MSKTYRTMLVANDFMICHNNCLPDSKEVFNNSRSNFIYVDSDLDSVSISCESNNFEIKNRELFDARDLYNKKIIFENIYNKKVKYYSVSTDYNKKKLKDGKILNFYKKNTYLNDTEYPQIIICFKGEYIINEKIILFPLRYIKLSSNASISINCDNDGSLGIFTLDI